MRSDSGRIEGALPRPPPETDAAQESRGAWLLALGVSLIYVSTWGLLSSHGTYQSYYETTLLADESTNAIAWIGTAEALLLILGGVVTGPIYDAGYAREMLWVGSLLTVLGVMMLSLSTEYYQIMLAQGVVGIGSGIVYPPSITLVAATFGSKYRGLAVSFATCGTAIGGIMFPIVLDRLLPSLGFAWATRVLGLMTLAGLFMGLALILPRIPETKSESATAARRRLVDLGALTEPVFVVMCLGVFFLWIAYWVPFFLIPTYAEFGLGASSSLAFCLLVVANASGIPGRFLAVLVIPYVGNAGGMVAFGGLSAVVIFGWAAVHNTAGFIAWSVALGLVLAPLAVFQPTIVPQLTPRGGAVGTRMGMSLASAGLGVLVGVPASTALINTETGEFWKMQVFIGTCMVVGTLLLAFVWWRLWRPGVHA